MSLISTRNLVAPLTNKLHMISIVLLTVGFVALRLSGAAVRLEQKESGRAAPAAAEDLTDADGLPTLRVNRAAGSAASYGRKPDRSLDQFRDSVDAVRPPWEEKKAAAAEPSAAPAENRRKGGLDDIERQLGMK